MLKNAKSEMKGYLKCGAFVGFLARCSEITNIPKECLMCPRLGDCVIDQY
jgi:hypothetical protein